MSPGLALDGCGDPLHLTGTGKIELGRKEGVLPPPGKTGSPERVKDFWVIACAKEKQCGLRELVCDSDDLDSTKQATRTRLGVEISVSFEPPECVCGCRKFDAKEDESERNRRAEVLYGQYFTDEGAEEELEKYHCGEDRFRCHTGHYNDPDCPADCGCGTACSCGCCVLLAWVHWNGRLNKWVVLHKGVRRFIRPCLIDDPIDRLKRTDESDPAPQDGEPHDHGDPPPPPPPPPIN